MVDEVGPRTGAKARERTDQLLHELGLSERSGTLPARMSGGQKRRGTIGRALMKEPDPGLFDETPPSLDTGLGGQGVKLIRPQMKPRGTAAIMVTHDDRITHYADRVVSIVDGRVDDVTPTGESQGAEPGSSSDDE